MEKKKKSPGVFWGALSEIKGKAYLLKYPEATSEGTLHSSLKY